MKYSKVKSIPCTFVVSLLIIPLTLFLKDINPLLSQVETQPIQPFLLPLFFRKLNQGETFIKSIVNDETTKDHSGMVCYFQI